MSENRIRRGTDPSAEFDLAVVGGGALGCALAWEAASRGINTVLLEQDDFGSGTSANSLRIVHGGLRYLQRMDLRRARMSALERSALLRIAPHLVQPLGCVVPTRRSLLKGRMAMLGGLGLNAVVTADRNHGVPKDRHLPAGGLVTLETLAKIAPGLNLDGVTAGAQWFDARMLNPERLALSFALAAESRGALILNHHRVTAYRTDGARVAGVIAEDRLAGRRVELRSRLVADCRGAWAGNEAIPPGPRGPAFVKAANIILPDIGLRCAVGFPMRDGRGSVNPGRLLFAVPWWGVTIVGTWYWRDTRGPGADVSQGELDAMLRTFNSSYGESHFRTADIRTVHVGFMPASAHSLTGDAEPQPTDQPLCGPASDAGGARGLWYLQTEKWTTVRRLAQRCIDRLASEHELTATKSRTAALVLPGGGREEMAAARSALRHALLPRDTIQRLELLYGGRAIEVLALAARLPGSKKTVLGSGGVLAAELLHAIRAEHARTLGDLLRRTGLGSIGRPEPETLESMARVAAKELAWDEEEQRRQIAEVLSWPQYQVYADIPASRTSARTESMFTSILK